MRLARPEEFVQDTLAKYTHDNIYGKYTSSVHHTTRPLREVVVELYGEKETHRTRGIVGEFVKSSEDVEKIDVVQTLLVRQEVENEYKLLPLKMQAAD